jgi:hypothetical protein
MLRQHSLAVRNKQTSEINENRDGPTFHDDRWMHPALVTLEVTEIMSAFLWTEIGLVRVIKKDDFSSA